MADSAVVNVLSAYNGQLSLHAAYTWNIGDVYYLGRLV